MPPSWLLWLLPVLLAPLLAVAWSSWTHRARGPAAPEQTVREHQRFREALERTGRSTTRSAPRSAPRAADRPRGR